MFVSVLAGLFQSTGWPSVVSIVANWSGKGKRGLIMGIWNAHTSVGNILGTVIAAAMLSRVRPGGCARHEKLRLTCVVGRVTIRVWPCLRVISFAQLSRMPHGKGGMLVGPYPHTVASMKASMALTGAVG